VSKIFSEHCNRLCCSVGDNVKSQVLSHTHRGLFDAWQTIVDRERRRRTGSVPRQRPAEELHQVWYNVKGNVSWPSSAVKV